MVFGRRNPLSNWKKLLGFLWPKGGWSRTARYLGKRIVRLSASPHVVAMGFATGVFASFTPFIGLHLVIAALLCIILGGNILASAFGTIVGNPLTFPLIWATTFELGSYMLGHTASKAPETIEPALSYSGLYAIWPSIKPMVYGAMPLGLLAAIVSYILVRISVGTYQKRRRQVLMTRLAHLAHLKDRRRQEKSEEDA